MPKPDVPARQLAAPAGRIAGVAWLPDGQLYFEAARWPARPDPTLLERPAADRGHRRGRPAHATVRAARRAGRPEPVGGDLAEGPGVRVPVRTSGSCAGIAALTAAGPQRWPTPDALDGRTWELDGYVFAAGDVYCAGGGRADLPVLAPDETALYFLASPDSVGVGGAVRREETPWRLYRWALSGDGPTGQPEELAGGLGKPLNLAISPDGRALAFAGQRDGSYGLWRVDTASRTVRRLASGKFVSAALSPDARQLATVIRQDVDRCFLYVLDLP